MHHSQILKRSWNILKNYRVLWLFGFILALTSGYWNTYNPGSSSGWHKDGNQNQPQSGIQCEGSDCTLTAEDWDQAFNSDEWDQAFASQDWQDAEDFFASMEEPSPQDMRQFITFIITVLVGILLIMLVAAYVRYVSENALIQMVDLYEASGEKLKFKAGWRLGTDRRAWWLFLINLMVDLPFRLTVLVLLGLVAASLFPLFANGKDPGSIIAIVALFGLFFVIIFLAVITHVILGVVKHLSRRACVLDEKSVGDSIHEGFRLIRENILDVGLMWLILGGINVGWSILSIPAFFLAVVLGVTSGGGVALIAGGIGGLFTSGVAHWGVAIVLGVLTLVLVASGIYSLFGGFYVVYNASSWTLAYRDLQALDGLAGEPEMPADPDPNPDPSPAAV